MGNMLMPFSQHDMQMYKLGLMNSCYVSRHVCYPKWAMYIPLTLWRTSDCDHTGSGPRTPLAGRNYYAGKHGEVSPLNAGEYIELQGSRWEWYDLIVESWSY